MLRTLQQYTYAHRILGLIMPSLFGYLFYINILTKDVAMPLALLSFSTGLYLLIQKIRYQYRDDKAFTMLATPSARLDKYEVSRRVFFIDPLDLESYIMRARQNGLKLIVHENYYQAKVKKSHVPAFRKGSDKV